MLLKQLILMLEGQGDEAAVPGLIQRLIERHAGYDALYMGQIYRVNGITKIAKDSGKDFLRYMQMAIKYRDLGAVLLLLDGDAKNNPFDRTKAFCAKEVACTLAKIAQEKARAGDVFSFAAVFAVQEFESWILAGHPDFRNEMNGKNVEDAPRNAKGKIKELTGISYRETLNQVPLTQRIEMEPLLTRQPRVRSFLRLNNATRELIEAVRTGKHIATPCPKERG
ncbi:MAG: DUF4276 family protein [Planctomycetaceae bacterium]|nr:DUF4276 family protein [Planctomycetaceae bacterium]